MRKVLGVVVCLMVIILSAGRIVHAGLINYERRNRLLRGEPTAELPGWMKKIPLVKNRYERRYDVNRDGKLQTAEVKVLLRDVVRLVEKKGGALIRSDILLEYDESNSGIIELDELDKLKEDAGMKEDEGE